MNLLGSGIEFISSSSLLTTPHAMQRQTLENEPLKIINTQVLEYWIKIYEIDRKSLL
jgi:hypothetical protein